MLSYQAREFYKFLNKRMKEFEPNIEIIFKFSNEYKTNTTECLKKVLSTTMINKNAGITYYGVDGGKLIESFKCIIKEFKNKFNFFDVFSKYSILKNDINEYAKSNNILNLAMEELFEEIDNFFLLYQSFMQSESDEKLAINFGQCAKEVEKMYNTIKIVYQSVEKDLVNYISEDIEEKGYKKLNIQLLGMEYSFEEFTNKLKMINDIYCEIGNVLYNNSSYCKLQIIKIESGSLLSNILGDKNIIEAISILFNKTVNLIFSKFTYEGKTYRHKEFREELLSDAKVIQELKNIGYNVEEAERNNQEALTMLTKDLLKLSSNSTKIKIDEKEYNIKEEMKQKFLESGNILQLSSGDPENKTK